MKHPKDARRAPLILALFVLAMSTLGTGAYFMAFRPPLLPEDIRVIGLGPGDAPDALLRWLSIVFRTWGGFMVGFGLCLLGIAGSFWDARGTWLRLGTSLGVVFAFSSFLASNLQLESDFLWFIVVLFVVACGTALLLLGHRERRQDVESNR
jgi:hypothetical protein